jgi:hypothetical protein
VTVINVVHGPLLVGPTCFSIAIRGVWVRTSNTADAVLPVPPFVDDTLPVVLVITPADEPVTVTPNVQLLFAAMLAPVSEIVLGAVVVKEPPHCAEDDVPTVTPAGNTSVNCTPVKVVDGFGLDKVKVNSVVLPT